MKIHFPKEQWLPDFSALLDEHVAWLNVGKLLSPAAGITDKTRKVVTVENTEKEKPAECYQYELKEDPNCRLLRLGFTKKEVEEILK